jgi:hypothetical protein
MWMVRLSIRLSESRRSPFMDNAQTVCLGIHIHGRGWTEMTCETTAYT